MGKRTEGATGAGVERFVFGRAGRPAKRTVPLVVLIAALTAAFASGPPLGAAPDAPSEIQAAPGSDAAAKPKKSLSAFPILMYDSDIGVGYGGKAKFVNYLRRRESFDLILFNSSKGERWYVFTFSIPDTEIRQGTRYGLSFDLRAEYDKYVKYRFYGLGPDSLKADETVASYLKEEMGLTVGHGFSPVVVAEAAYVLRRYKTFNVTPGQPFSDVLQAEGTKFSPYLSLTVRYDTSNSQIHPTRGVRFLVQNDFAGPAVANKAGTYYRMTLDLRSYNRLFFKGAVLAVRGLVQQVTGSNIPLWDLSTLGGGSTMSAMRGYALNRFMDKGKFLACAEFRFPIWKRLGGNAFTEAGLVWPRWSAIAFRKTAVDAGWGLRYYLANFVVRFDMGFSREGTGIYFNFGHLF